MPQITVDTGINTKPVLQGAKEMTSAIRSLQGWVAKAGKSMDASLVGYAKAMQNNAQASKEFKVQIDALEDSAQSLQNQMKRISETRIETKEYTQIKKEIAEADKTLTHLLIAGEKDVEEINAVKQALAELIYEKEQLEKGNKAFVSPETTEDYRKAAEKLREVQDKLTAAREQGMNAIKPIHIQQWESMRTATAAVANALGKVLNAALLVGHALLHPFQTLNRIIPIVLSGMANLAAKAINVAVSFAKMVGSRVVETVQRLGRAALNAASGLARMVITAPIAVIQRLANAAKNAAVNLAKMAGNAVMSGVKKIGTMAANASKAILGIGKSARRSNGGIKQAISMLIRYGLGIRSLFILVRRLRSAVVDAFKNMAQSVPEVNKAISSLSASLGRLKNSLATAFQPILSAVAPYLTQLMDLLSEAMTRVGMFFAALTGQNYVYKATKANYDYAKSLDKTKQSAKAAENQLASFDELNILRAPNDSDSGNAVAADGGEFVKVPLESGIKEFVNTLKQMIKGGEFAEIGDLLAERINKFIGSIDWNGYAVKIGNLINSLTEFYNAFMEGIDWGQIGSGIASAINGLVDTVNFEDIGRALTQRVNALFKILRGFVDDINALELGEALRTALSSMVKNINTEEMGETLNQAIHKLLDVIKPALGDEETWRLAGYKLAIMLNRLFGTNQSGETVWTRLADAIVTVAKDVIAALTGFVSGFEWGQAGEDFRTGVMKLVDEFPLDDLGGALSEAFGKALDFLLPVVQDEKFWNRLGAQFALFANSLLKKDWVWSNIGKTINSTMAGLLEFGEGLLGDFNETNAANRIKDALSEIKWGEIATQTWELAKEAFKKAGNFLNVLFGEYDIDKYNLVKGKLDYPEELADRFMGGGGSIGYKIAEKLSKAIASVDWKNFGAEAGEIARGLFLNIADFFNKLVSDGTVEKAVKEFFGGLPDDLATTAVNAARGFLKALARALITTFASMLKDDEAEEAVLKAQGQLLDDVRKKIGDEKLNEIRVDLRTAGITLDNIEEKKTELENIFKKYEYLDIDTAHWSVIIDADKFESTMDDIWDDFQKDAENEFKDAADAGVDGYIAQAKARQPEVEDASKDMLPDFDYYLKDEKNIGGEIVDNVADSYIEQANARKEDIQDANGNVFLPSPEELHDKAKRVGEAMTRELSTAFAILDETAPVWGQSTIDEYFNAFKSRYTENGVIKSDFEMAVDEILGAGATAAFNNGQMNSETFWVAWQNHMRDKQPETTEALNSAVADTYEGFPDAGDRAGAGLANGTWSSFIQSTLDNQGDAEEAVLSTFDYLWEAVNAEGNGEMVAVDWMNSFVETVEDEEGRVKPEFLGVVERMFGSFDAYNKAKLNGKDFLYGLVNGMAGEEDETKNKLVGIIDSILKFVQHSPKGLDSNSPSKRAERYGRDFMVGFQNGTQDEKTSVSSTLLGIFSEIANSGKDGLESVDMSEPFESEWSDISDAMNSNLSTMQSDLSGSMSSMEGTTQSSVQQQTQPFYDNWKAAIWIVRQSLSTMSSEISSSMRTIAATVQQGMHSVANTMSNSMGNLAYAVHHVNWWNIGDSIVAGIQRGVQDNWRWLERTVWNLAIRLYNTACNALGIHSPSKLFREGVGQMIGLGVAEGFEDTEPTIMNSVTEVADAMANKMASTDMRFDVGAEQALGTFSDKIADSFATLLDRLQTIADSVAFRTPAVAAGTVVPYNIAAQSAGTSNGIVETLEASNDDLANVVIQATNNAALAIVEAIQRYGGAGDNTVSTNRIIDEINRRARAQGASPILT